MKATLTKGQAVIAAAVTASLALASGCSSDRGGDYDYSTTSYGYSTSQTPSQSSTARASELSATGGTNSVIPLYKESLAVGKREVDAGSVRVKKIVKTETVNEPVELRHEEIVIERQPASETASNPSGAAFQEQETVIHLSKEEPVVEKRTASAGQVVLQSRSLSRETNIQAQVRSEDVAVIKSGDTENVTVGQNISESGNAMGAAETPSGQATGQSMSGTITDPTTLNSGAGDLSGRPVEFSGLKVKSVMGDHIASLDSGDGRSVYVYSAQGGGSLKPGDSVNVKGIVKTSASDLNGTELQILSSQSAYVDAQKIERAGQ
jgi:uncharacterized protein (TIGR02271 family)